MKPRKSWVFQGRRITGQKDPDQVKEQSGESNVKKSGWDTLYAGGQHSAV